MRTARAQLIGGVSGMVVSLPVVFYGIGFSAHPHRVGLAMLVTGLLLVSLAVFNWWLYGTTKARATRLSGAQRTS